MTARLGREVVAYILSPSTSKSQSPSYAAIVNLHHLNASSPIAHLRGTTPIPSSSSFTLNSDGDNTLMLHADTSRPLIHAHEHQSGSSASTVSLAARLHPPEITNTLALSPSGTLLAAGSASGRIYIWYLASGNLIASFDAHFRSVTCLEWTSCEKGLISASQDARILVWSVAALVDEANSNPKSYAIFSDHVQPVTCIQLSSSSKSNISSFPSSTQLLSSSIDGTVKLWDIRSRSLIATWAFSGPVNHLAVEVGFRAFFAATRGRLDDEDGQDMNGQDENDEQQNVREWDMIRRIDLYGNKAEESVSSTSAINRGKGKVIWKPKESSTRIAAMTLSSSASHLLVGTSEAQLHVIDVASSLLIRSASLIPTGNPSTDIGVTNLQTFLYQDSSSNLASTMTKSRSTYKLEICEKLQRTKEEITTFSMKLPRGRAAEIASRLTPPSLDVSARQRIIPYTQLTSSSSSTSKEELQMAQKQITKLEAENEKLNDLLRRAQKTNAGLWEKVVKEAT